MQSYRGPIRERRLNSVKALLKQTRQDDIRTKVSVGKFASGLAVSVIIPAYAFSLRLGRRRE